MRHLIRLLCLFFAWGLVGLASICAEEWPYGDVPDNTLSGGVIAPASPQENIRMDGMKINILPQDDSYVVDAVFRLFNTGETTTEWVGFPKQGEYEDVTTTAPSAHDRVIRDFIRFEGWVNGIKEPFEEKYPFLRANKCPSPGRRLTGSWEQARWMAKKVTFPRNALTTVRMRYEAPYATCWNCSIRPYKHGSFYFGPGKYWKGSIAEVEIVLQNPDTATHHRRMTMRCPGTSLSGKMTRAKTRITIELRQLAPSAYGTVIWSQVPDSKTIRYKDLGNE